MKCVARAPGTCGELVQGTEKDNNFLVTCPINLYSVARVSVDAGPRQVTVNGDREKTVAAVEKLLDLLKIDDMVISIHIDSQLPTGKGMASSTSDITAALVATAEALESRLTPAEIARLAISVEPTDGLMFPGVMVFDHIQGITCRTLGKPPEIDLLVVDTGGMVDTKEFNSRVNLQVLNRLNEPVVGKAMELLKEGIKTQNYSLVGDAVTMSAFANQKILEKPFLKELYLLCLEFGGIGINVAHSGTVVGLLFERNSNVKWNLLKAQVKKLINSTNADDKIALEVMGPYKLIGGGAEILESGGEIKEWHPYCMSTVEISVQQQKSLE